jgi:flavin-dependent dehydrogenase
MNSVVVIGGGLSGLISAILLQRAGFKTTLIEKKAYPFHRVCGEYISNEVIPFLKASGLYPEELDPVDITHFELTDVKGRRLDMPLDLGGFGISRFEFDHWLCKIATSEGVDVQDKTTVREASFHETEFTVVTSKETLVCDYVIGAYGKRSTLDRTLDRPFFKKRSPFIGVKYHVNCDVVDPSTVSLHNFPGGYCGINRVSEDIYNLCYLSESKNLKEAGEIQQMERTFLFQNPVLKKVFEHSYHLFEQPVVINEISFAPKEPVYNHILMTGDAAGMITPLCGNGMAMAIHGAKLVTDALISLQTSGLDRSLLESTYSTVWKTTFDRRHWSGRQIQSLLFGSVQSSAVALRVGKSIPMVSRWLMRKTHGVEF